MHWERSRVYFCIVTATGITETGGQTLKISCHTALEIKATDAQLAQSHSYPLEQAPQHQVKWLKSNLASY